MATRGLDDVTRRWHGALADIDAYAKTGDPRDVYPKNHEFWRATAALLVALSTIDDLPLSLDFAVSRGTPMTSTLEHALRRLEVVREGFVVRNLDGSAKTDGQANADRP